MFRVGNGNVRTCTLTLLYVHRHSCYMTCFYPQITVVWLNGWTPDDRDAVFTNTACRPGQPDRTACLSAAASVTSDKLVWLSDAVMRADGARTTRKHDRTSNLFLLLMIRMEASRSPYIPVTANVGIRLLPCWHWNVHVSLSGVACLSLWILPLLQGLPVHGPCVLFPHRWEGRSPRSLETACKWIMRMPLIYSQSQSAAVHLASEMCLVFVIKWANRDFFFLNPHTLFKCSLVQSLYASHLLHTQMPFHQCEKINVIDCNSI